MLCMSNDADDEEAGTGAQAPARDSEVTTVARAILIAYFDKLADSEGFAEIVPKLRKAILENGQFNDVAIRAALFPDGA
jgi:hypothetical protein